MLNSILHLIVIVIEVYALAFVVYAIADSIKEILKDAKE